jgi:hypothetical protein
METTWTTIFWGGGVVLLKAAAEFIKTCFPVGYNPPPWIMRGALLLIGLLIGIAAGRGAGLGIEAGLLSGFIQTLAALGLYALSGWNRDKANS